MEDRREELLVLEADWLATSPRLKERPEPSRAMVSKPVPPSTRASCVVLPPLPKGLLSAVRLEALRMKRSLPAPPRSTSAPPLPVRVSLPAPAAKVSAEAVPVWMSLAVVPSQSTADWEKAPEVEPKIT